MLYYNNWFTISNKSGYVIVATYLTFLTIIKDFYIILGYFLPGITGGMFINSGIYRFLPL